MSWRLVEPRAPKWYLSKNVSPSSLLCFSSVFLSYVFYIEALLHWPFYILSTIYVSGLSLHVEAWVVEAAQRLQPTTEYQWHPRNTQEKRKKKAQKHLYGMKTKKKETEAVVATCQEA